MPQERLLMHQPENIRRYRQNGKHVVHVMPPLDRYPQCDRHMLANDADGCHVATCDDETFFRPEPSGWEHLQDSTVTGLGMLPVVDYLEPGQHRGTVVNDPIATLPEPDRAAVQQRLIQVDDGLLELIHHEERGVIRFGQAVDRAALIAEIALAFPKATIAVAVATCEQARHLGRQLRQRLDDVTVLTRDHEPGYVGRIVVAPFLKMAFYAVRIEHRNIFIAADALEVLSERGTEAMDNAWRARLYALLPDGAPLPPYDEAKLRSYFGFSEAHIPQLGHQPLPVSVLFAKVQGGPSVPLDATDLEIKRWIWTNPMRNRRIATLAKALRCGDWQAIQQRFPELGCRTGIPPVRVPVGKRPS